MRPVTRPRIRKLGVVTLTLVFTLAALIGSSTASVAAAGTKSGLGQLLAAHALSDNVRGIATFASAPSASQVDALTSLGLKVQPMSKVRLALVAGPVSAMKKA